MILQAASKEYIPAVGYMVVEDPESVYNVVKCMAEKPDSKAKFFICLHLIMKQESLLRRT